MIIAVGTVSRVRNLVRLRLFKSPLILSLYLSLPLPPGPPLSPFLSLFSTSSGIAGIVKQCETRDTGQRFPRGGIHLRARVAECSAENYVE